MKKTVVLRWSVRLLVLAAVTLLAVMHQVRGGGPSGVANLHTVCPLGGLETLFKLITEGGYVAKLAESNIILIIAVVLITIFFARFFCGWICALGTMQDIFSKAGKRLGIRKVSLPLRVDSLLRLVKFPILLGLLYLTWKTGALIINSFDPFAAYGHIPAGAAELFEGYLAGFIILAISLFGSLFIPRLFCRYMCPLGAVVQIFSYARIFKIKRDNGACISCGKCDLVCPVDIKVSTSGTVSGGECLTCYECLENCPVKPALRTELFKSGVKPIHAALTALLIFFGIIGMTAVSGIWSQLPGSTAEALSGDAANIRGWMTFQDVADGFGLTLDEIYRATGLDREIIPADIPMKEMDEILIRNGIKADHSDIKAILIELAGKEELISGGMTLREVAEKLAIPVEQVPEVLGIPELPADVPLRELKDEHGLNMNILRERGERFKAHAENDCASCPGC